jgi:DNA-binding NtrC family response regulator
MSTRILYLDDEEPLVFIVNRMLKHLGHAPSCFSRADEALAAFAAAPDQFDLVLTDMAMPGMNGVDFAAEIFKLRPQMRVAIVTGYAEQKDADRALAIGVKAVINKPATLDELRQTVAEMLVL